MNKENKLLSQKILLFVIVIVLSAILVYAASFDTISQADFNLGTYANTSYNGAGVILNGSNLTGSYTSKIFDAGTSAARWDNLTNTINITSAEFLYLVDNSAGIWQSKDSGVTWTNVSEDYNPGVGNTGAVNIVSNSSGSLFVANGQDLWGSDDKGTTWRLVNDDTNGAGDSNDAAVISIYQNTIYIIDMSEDVLKSTDSGITFIKVNNTDFNGGNGAAKAMTTNSSGAIFVIDAQADAWQSVNEGVSWIQVKDDFNNGNGNGLTGDLKAYNNTLFALDAQDLWKSTDSGIIWTLVNDDFNGGPDSGNGQALTIDSNGYIYIADGSEDIYKSTDSGVSFTRTIANLNGADGLIKGLTSIIYRANLTFQVRNCSQLDCSDASFLGPDGTANSYYNNGIASFSKLERYFQYKAYFTSQDTSITSKLYNTSVGYTILDSQAPGISSYVENPGNNSAYSPSQTYSFNAIITDSSGISNVWIEFQGINYTSITNLSSVYTFTTSNLAAGTYSYRWWANDTFGNLNSSELRYYTISKASSSSNMQITGTSPIVYGTISDFAGQETNLGDSSCSYSLDKSNGVYGVGTIIFNYSTSGCSNYTAGSVTKDLVVNKAANSLTLSSSAGWNYSYGTITTLSCSVGIGTAKLYQDNIEISNPKIITLGAGSYSIKCNISESQNYSASSLQQTLYVNKQATTTTISATPATPITYGITSNFSCSNSAGFDANLFVNGIDKSSEKGLNVIRGAGNYIVSCNSTGNANYAESSQQATYFIEKSSGDIRLYLNNQENNITIQSIEQSNISATTLYGNLLIYLDGLDITIENGLNVLRSSGYYNVTAFSLGDENHSSASKTLWLNVTLDSIPPLINIASPQDGATYGNNESLALNFSAYDINLDSCWYNLGSGNISLTGCQNITFSVSGSGSYTLLLYANDSYGNLNEKTSAFTVNIGAPSIGLVSPLDNSYLNYSNIELKYIPSDIDLLSCELWGDFDGEFKLNQTSASLINNVVNTFSLNLSDGTYKWNIRCSDSAGHSSFNGNKTFYIDTLNPSLLITQPSGTRTSRTGITLTFTASDANLGSCWYNVYRGASVEIANTSVNCSTASSFGVTVDADFVLTLYANDSAGNVNSATSSFSVSTSTPPANNGNTGGGGGSSGGGGGGITTSIVNKTNVEFERISDLIINPGEVKKMSARIKNSGNKFLNNCKLKGLGEYSSWLSSEDVKGISSGEITEFAFDLKVPLTISPGVYNLALFLTCRELNGSTSFNAEMIEKKIAIKFEKIEKKTGEISITYSLEELLGREQNVNVEIILFGSKNERAAEIKENRKLDANKKEEFQTSLKIPADLNGEFNLLLNANSEFGLNFIQENVILGKSKIGGLSVILQDPKNDKYFTAILIALFLVFSFFVVKRIVKGKKESSRHFGFVKLRRR